MKRIWSLIFAAMFLVTSISAGGMSVYAAEGIVVEEVLTSDEGTFGEQETAEDEGFAEEIFEDAAVDEADNWDTSETYEDIIESDSLIPEEEEVVLLEKEYKLRVQANGGYFTDGKSKDKYPYMDFVVKPDKTFIYSSAGYQIIRDGYMFMGFALSKDSTEVVYGTPSPTGDFSFTATLEAKNYELFAVWGEPLTEGLTLSEKELHLWASTTESKSITAHVIGDALKDKKVTFEITDDDDSIEVITIKKTTEDGKTIEIVPNSTITETKKAIVTASVSDDKGTEYKDSCVVTVSPSPVAKAPVSSVEQGPVKKGTIVYLTTKTPLADIYFGREPVDSYELYSDGIVITEDTVIKAYSKREGYENSETVSFMYTVIKDDWGDVTDPEVQSLFGKDSSNLPSGIWYVLADEDNPCSYYKGDAKTNFVKVYTGSEITFNESLRVYLGNERLYENRDYTLKFSNNKLVGDKNQQQKPPCVTVTGKGNYKGKAVLTFSIKKANINAAAFTSERSVAVASGPKAVLANTRPVISFAGKKLTLNKDYALEYYKDPGLSEADKVSDPYTQLITDKATFYVRAVALSSSCFDGKMTDYVTIRGISKGSVTEATKLKLTDNNSKALKLSYDAKKDGEPIKLLQSLFEGENPTAIVWNGKSTLKYGTDYTVDVIKGYDYKSAGKHSFVVNGGGEKYIGSKTFTFEIVGTSMKKVKIAGLKSSVEYTHKNITWDDLYDPNNKVIQKHNNKSDTKWNGITLYVNDTKLEKGKDYECTPPSIDTLGKFSLRFVGIGAYTGTITKTITVKAYNIKNDVRDCIEVHAEKTVYAKEGARPEVSVVLVTERDALGNIVRSIPLEEGIDYTLSFKNNKKVVEESALGSFEQSKRPTVIVKGKGNFTGSDQSEFFAIEKADISNTTLFANDVIYNPNGKTGYFKAVPKLMDGGSALKAGSDYDLDGSYEYYYANTDREPGRISDTDKVKAGTLIRVVAKVSCSASSFYTSDNTTKTLEGYYKVIDKDKDISKFSARVIDASGLSFDNGKDVSLFKEENIEVSYKAKGKTAPVKLSSSDYEIISIKNNKFIGTASVTIRGKGEYGGTKTFTFRISARSMN